MRVPVQWLREFVPFTQSVEDVAERLSVSGLEVESLDDCPDGDRVIDVDILPNMARCMAVLGVAREVSALMQAPLHADLPLASVPARVLPITPRIEDPVLCRRLALLRITGVGGLEAPAWLRQRLAAAGFDSVSGLVDVGNYVMLELGQPLHVYDADALDGPNLRARAARAGESLPLLSQPATAPPTALQAGIPVIADEHGAPVAVAGVVGGRPTAVSPSTTSILVEAASFDFLAIRRSQTALGLVTESSARFSRGVDPELVETALRRFTLLMKEVYPDCTVEAFGDARAGGPAVRDIELDVDELNSVIGAEYAVDDVASVFTRLGLSHRRDGRVFTVTVGDERSDLWIPHDLMEEVVRVHGLGHIPATTAVAAIPMPHRDRVREGHAAIRESLIRSGLTETISYTLSSPELHAAVGGSADGPLLSLLNPLSSELRVTRRSLLPGLLKTVETNIRHTPAVHVFEHGVVVLPEAEGIDPALPSEHQRVAVAMVGDVEPDVLWSQSTRPVDIYDLADVVLAIFEDLHVGGVELRPADVMPFRSTACAEVVRDGRVLGHLGLVREEVASALRLDGHQVFGAELDADAVVELRRTGHDVVLPSRYPSVHLDISVAVPWDTLVGDLLAGARAAGGDELVSVAVFDVFSGPSLPGRKAVGLRLTINSGEHTLTTREAEEVRDRVVEHLVRAYEAERR